MPNSLPKNATLRDLLPTLEKPESFVRQVVGVMHEATKEHGAIVMRLGITGTGRAPNYRIERSEGGAPIMALDGANHKQWPEGENFAAAPNWSSAIMTKDEVANLLGEIRGYRPSGRGPKV